MPQRLNNSSRIRTPSLKNTSEDDVFVIALEEILNDTRQKAIWAQALKRSNDDDHKAKAIYIRLRTKQLNTSRISQQINSGTITFDCPDCGSPISVDTDIVLACTHNHSWDFECPECNNSFDIRDALPDQAINSLLESTPDPNPPISPPVNPSKRDPSPEVSHFSPELRSSTIIIIVILALIFGVRECNKFKMQKKLSDAYRNHPSQWQR
ncbi:MAG: hypothetical protein ACOX7N_11040 [Lawsonibacter sp.]|jgi:predicted RNA-binding Zn-ribbon protein involved in translation (DUF1610 family)